MPSYKLCTDPLDITQLTDGKARGSNWTKKGTVGWLKVKSVVEIVIDLNARCVIDEVRVYTVGGGGADVEFPKFVAVFVSDDSEQFRFAGLKSNDKFKDVRSSGYPGISGTMTIDGLNASGRYVKLIIKPNLKMFFVDEIEVYGRANAFSESRDNLQIFSEPATLIKKAEAHLRLRENIIAALEQIKERKFNFSTDFKSHLLSNLNVLASQIGMPIYNLHSADELNDIAEKFGQIKARLYNEVYQVPLIFVSANPMEILFEKEICVSEKLESVNVHLWQNEHESTAFNVINCSDEELTVTFSISPFADSNNKIIDSSNTFEIRRAAFVQASVLGSIADALILQNTRPVTLNPGELTQIWLSVFNPDLKAGIYKASIAVLVKNSEGRKLPIEPVSINLEVDKKVFPKDIALAVCNFSYYRCASDLAMSDDLRDHYTNVGIITSAEIPFPRSTSDPPTVWRKPDFSKLDNALSRNNYAGTYLLGFAFTEKKKDSGRFGVWMSPEWKRKFSFWLKDLETRLRARGLDYNQWALYPFDETLCKEFYELAVFVKRINPKIRIYANSFGKGPADFKRFKDLVDVWCLLDRYCQQHPEWVEMIKNFGKEVWTYGTLGPGKANHPYSYYRLMPWRSFKRGQKGAGFWVYYPANKAIPWNDTLEAFGDYGVVYASGTSPFGRVDESITPSRRWEAWREGVEDYQYLYEVRQAINKISETNPALATQAKRQLSHLVNRVIESANDPEVVYKVRKTLSEMLLKLADENKL